MGYKEDCNNEKSCLILVGIARHAILTDKIDEIPTMQAERCLRCDGFVRKNYDRYGD
jgi:hypothetical protein